MVIGDAVTGTTVVAACGPDPELAEVAPHPARTRATATRNDLTLRIVAPRDSACIAPAQRPTAV